MRIFGDSMLLHACVTHATPQGLISTAVREAEACAAEERRFAVDGVLRLAGRRAACERVAMVVALHEARPRRTLRACSSVLHRTCGGVGLCARAVCVGGVRAARDRSRRASWWVGATGVSGSRQHALLRSPVDAARTSRLHAISDTYMLAWALLGQRR